MAVDSAFSYISISLTLLGLEAAFTFQGHNKNLGCEVLLRDGSVKCINIKPSMTSLMAQRMVQHKEHWAGGQKLKFIFSFGC